MNRIIFLGTGGSRHVMSSQARQTGGIYIELDNVKFAIDPGPGTLVYSRKLGLNPESWDGLLLSHLHPDHSTDANALLDGINHGSRRAFVVAEEHCLRLIDQDRYYPCISLYNQQNSDVCLAKAGEKFRIKGMEITAVLANHYDPCVGFVVKGTKKIGYTADGSYYKGQEKSFEGCDMLIINVLVPYGLDIKKGLHMNLEEAIELCKAIKQKPKLAFIHHFSPTMLDSNLDEQARIFEEQTGIKTIATEDFMEIDVDTLKRVKK
jgi:ribonuclease BN (tRNA processing enzyme)